MGLRKILNRRPQVGDKRVASRSEQTAPVYSESESVVSAKAREREAAMNFRNIACKRSSDEGEEGHPSVKGTSRFTSNTVPEQPIKALPDDNNRRPSCYTPGREFYDDGYDSSHASLEDRLDFSDLKLAGRDQELQALHDVYSHVNRKGVDANKPIDLKVETSVAIIHGLSGTGKSTLVKQFVEDLNKKSLVTGGPTKPYFLSGKYDELSGGDPFSAIVEAFSGFAQSLLLDLENQGESSAAEVKRIRSTIQSALGEDAHVMATIVPSLRDLIVSEDALTTPTVSSENAWNRLKYIFQVFSNAISTAKRPVVMFLDDLQWSDSASLELLEALLTDKDLRYFMFIGAYRSNEVEQGDELMTRIESISSVQGIKEVELTNLSLGELNEFIADALHIEEERDRAISLTEVIHARTSGNIFFAVQLIEELQRKGVLLFSRMTFEWEWNLESADNLDNLVSNDVIAAVTSKIMSAPEIMQKALISMAYTRSTVDMDTIGLLLEMDGYFVKANKLEKILEKAVLDGLLTNRMGSESYSFAHDRIQQAAYEMIPSGRERDDYRLKMGRRLYKIGSFAASGKDWLLFAAADHLNATSIMLNAQEIDPLYLTKINLEVGTRAASIAAFETASKFLGLAMGCLLQRVKDPWENEYDIVLKVYQGIVNAELCQGHFEIGRGIAHRVLAHARTPEDKLPTQIALAKALGREAKHGESYQLSEAALHDLEVLPKGFVGFNFGFVRDLGYVKKYLKKHSDEEILSLPVLKDEHLKAVLPLISAYATQAYYCKKSIESLAGNLKIIRLSLKHGISASTTLGILTFCLFSQATNDKETVDRLSNLATDLLEKAKSKEVEVYYWFLSSYYIQAWKAPHDDVIASFERGEKAGMEAGDFENALLCPLACNYYKFISGFHLEDLDWTYRDLTDKFAKYKVPSMAKMSIQQHSLVQHLIGQLSPDFQVLEKFGFSSTNDGTENYEVLFGCLGRIQIGIYFGKYEFAEKMINIVSSIWDMDESFNITNLRFFCSAIVYASLARQRGQKKKAKQSYLKKARSASKSLKAVCKLKGMKCYHRHLLAEAHIAGAESTGSSVPKRYNEAIAAALENGYKHDVALGGQLAAEFFLDMDDENLITAPLREAKNKLVREKLTLARDSYLSWGAKGLVRHLETKHALYLSPTQGLFDEQSTNGDSNAVTFLSVGDEADYGMASVVLPKSIAPSVDSNGKADDVSVLTGLTGATGFTGPTYRMDTSDRTGTLGKPAASAGFDPIGEDEGFCPLQDSGW